VLDELELVDVLVELDVDVLELVEVAVELVVLVVDASVSVPSILALPTPSVNAVICCPL